MKRVATAEDPLVVGIPLVLGVTVVRLEPQVVLIVFDVEDVQVTVGIRTYAQAASQNTTLRVLPGLNRIRDLESPSCLRQAYSFFERFAHPLSLTLVKANLNVRTLGSAVGSHNHRHIRLVPSLIYKTKEKGLRIQVPEHGTRIQSPKR